MKKYFFIAFAMFAIQIRFASAAVEISDGSVKALYHFDTLLDSSGYGNDLSSTSTFATSSGLFNTRIDLSDNTNFLTTFGSALSTSSPYTVGFWFNDTSSGCPGTRYAVELNKNDNVLSLNCFGGNDATKQFVWSNNGNFGVASTTPTIGHNDGYHQVVFSINANRFFTFYLDGALNTFGFLAPQDLTVPTKVVLGNYDNGSHSFVAFMEEMFVLNRATTLSEVQALYNGGAGTEICTTPNCGMPQGSNEAIQPQFPAQGSSHYRFDNWIAKVSHFVPNKTYRISVHSQFQLFGPYFSDIFADDVFFSTSSDQVSVSVAVPHAPRSITFPVGITTTSVQVSWSLYDQSNVRLAFTTSSFIFNPAVPGTATTTVEFVLPQNVSGTTPSSTIQFSFVQNYAALATSSNICTYPSNIVDVAGGMSYAGCAVWNYLANQAREGATGIVDAVNSQLSQVYPFRAAYLLQNGFSSSSLSDTPTISSTLPFFNNGSVIITSSSTLTAVIGTQGRDLLFNFQNWLFQGAKVYVALTTLFL